MQPGRASFGIPSGVRMGGVPTWESAFQRDPEWRNFLDNKRMMNPGHSQSDIIRWWDEYRSRRGDGLGRIVSMTSTPSPRTQQRRKDRDLARAEIKSRREDESDLRWLSGYDDKREKLMKDLDHQDAQVRANAKRRLADLEIERQLKENKLATTIPVGVQQLRASETKRTEIRGVIEELNKWIADNPDKPEAIAEVNKLIKQAERPGASAASIARQAESIAFAAERKAQREFGRKQKLQEERAEQTRSLVELRSELSEKSKQQDREFRAELEKARQTNASNTAIRKAREKMESIIREKQGDVANLIARIRSVGADVRSDGVLSKLPMLPEGSKLISDIESAATSLQGLIAEIEFYASSLPDVTTDDSGFGFDEGPQVGDVIDGYEYLGGDPSQQSSWRQVR